MKLTLAMKEVLIGVVFGLMLFVPAIGFTIAHDSSTVPGSSEPTTTEASLDHVQKPPPRLDPAPYFGDCPDTCIIENGVHYHYARQEATNGTL